MILYCDPDVDIKVRVIFDDMQSVSRGIQSKGASAL